MVDHKKGNQIDSRREAAATGYAACWTVHLAFLILNALPCRMKRFISSVLRDSNALKPEILIFSSSSSSSFFFTFFFKCEPITIIVHALEFNDHHNECLSIEKHLSS